MGISKFTILLLLAISLVGCTVFWKKSPTATHKTPDEVMQAYLSALRDQDEEEMLNLVVSGHNAKSEVHDKIQRYGGTQLENIKIHYELTPSSYHMSANFQADMDLRSTVETIRDKIWLKREGDYWFIVLGRPIHELPPLSITSVSAKTPCTSCPYWQIAPKVNPLRPIALEPYDPLMPSMKTAQILLEKYDWTIEERLADYRITLPQSFVHPPGTFPIPIYWAYNNEFSKAIGLPLTPLLGKEVFATVYDLVEPLPRFLLPYTEARAVILTDGDEIVGAWIDKGRHNAFASSLDRRSWDEIVEKSWGEWLVDAGVVDETNAIELELATLTPEEVITRYVKAYNRRDVDITGTLYTRETLVRLLFSNMSKTDLFLADYPARSFLKAPILHRDRVRLNTMRQIEANKRYVEYAVDGLYFVILTKEVPELGWRIESIGTGP